jgi:hypothetical protein
MVESSYEIETIADGFTAIVRNDGAAIGVEIFDIMFELFKQNPRFFEVWMELAESYLMVGPEIGEA